MEVQETYKWLECPLEKCQTIINGREITSKARDTTLEPPEEQLNNNNGND